MFNAKYLLISFAIDLYYMYVFVFAVVYSWTIMAFCVGMNI